MIITGTGSALPKKAVTNDELAAFLDTSDEWIVSRTGIRERRLLTDERLEDLAAAAAMAALDMAGLRPGHVDYILLANVVNLYQTPALSCVVQGMIGASCPCIDINGACTGFIYALELAGGLICAGPYKNVLIICAEANSQLVDWGDRSTCVLFGDGAAAAVVTPGGQTPRFVTGAQSAPVMLSSRNASGNCPYTAPSPHGYLAMNGQEVYKFAVNAAVSDLTRVLADAGAAPGDVAYYLMHQANLRILESARARLGQPRERFPINIDRYGNTSSASIPIMLDELNRGGRLKPGDLLAMSAFGAGLTSGAALLRWGA